jgi:hypothetical protein
MEEQSICFYEPQTKIWKGRDYGSQTKILDRRKMFDWPFWKHFSSLLTQIEHFYGPQTNILEGRANIRERIFKALFRHVITRFGRRSFEKCFQNTFPNVCSTFQNRRLGTITLSYEKCFQTDSSISFSTFQNLRLGSIDFRSTFRRFVAKIE